MNTIIRRSALGGVLLALAPLSAALPQEAAAAKADEHPSECACTCAACLAKHGPKAAPTATQSGPARVQLRWTGHEGAQTETGVVEVDLLQPIADDEALVAMLDEAARVVNRDDFFLGAGQVDDPAAPPIAAPPAAQERGYLGIFLGQEDGDGAKIGTVIDGTAAARGGLRAGDRIVAAEELPVRSSQDLLGVLSDLKPGDTATLEIERGDKEMRITVVLGVRPASDASAAQARGEGTNAAGRPSSGFFFEEPIVIDLEPGDEPIAMDVVIEEEPIIEDFEISDHNETVIEEPPALGFDTFDPGAGRRSTGRGGWTPGAAARLDYFGLGAIDLVGDGSVLMMPDGSVVVLRGAPNIGWVRPGVDGRRGADELRAQIADLEAQVAELEAALDEMQAALTAQQRRRR